MNKYENAIEKLISKVETIEEQLEKEASIQLLRSTIIRKIAKIEDVIANRADKTYHTWEWRHNDMQSRAVFEEMNAATANLRIKLEAVI